MPSRKAEAEWKGDLIQGGGQHVDIGRDGRIGDTWGRGDDFKKTADYANDCRAELSQAHLFHEVNKGGHFAAWE